MPNSFQEKKSPKWYFRAIKLPNGWVWIFLGFLVTNYFVYRGQLEADLKPAYAMIAWTGAVLQPNLSAEALCRNSFDSIEYIYDSKKMNRLRITNSSSVLAKRVRVKLKIRDELRFVFSIITVDQRYARGASWRIVEKDESTFKFIDLEVDSIKGHRDYCDVFFVYAYPGPEVTNKTVEEDALQVDIAWEGQRNTTPRWAFGLEY